MKNQLQILQHSLGLDQYGDGRQHRNHFVTGPGGKDFDDCNALVEAGLMKDHGISAISGGSNCFTVTPAGIDYVALNSPARPPAPKTTNSQKRYRDFLHNDGYDSFADYIGVNTAIESDRNGNCRYVNRNRGMSGPWRPTKKAAKAEYKELLRLDKRKQA